MKTVQLLNATKRFKIGLAELTEQDIICIQEHRFIHEDTVIK